MDLTEIKAELVALGLATVGGIGAVFKMLLNDRAGIERRIDKLERESIPRKEFDEFVREIREHNNAMRDMLDKRFDQMNGNILWLMHSNGSKNDEHK